MSHHSREGPKTHGVGDRDEEGCEEGDPLKDKWSSQGFPEQQTHTGRQQAAKPHCLFTLWDNPMDTAVAGHSD